MDSQALYRKWRPQTLSDVAGQEHVTRALKNALERGRVVHAYLFCGPRGTGKTSTGRILAKAVNCLTSGHSDPCNCCILCQSITSGSALDIIEIDAASNRGIDEIRDLREKVNFAPGQAKYKVYIIDEVHMLTDAAANALLKTLEEPPPYVIFILATTEAHKLLPTILSRCQRYDFRRLTQSAVVGRLAQICAGEGFQVQPEALGLIARAASGSLRDAVNLLEQMVNYYGTAVQGDQVKAVLGITGDQRSRELARHIAAMDTAAALQTLHLVVQDGIDLRQFQRELLEYLRQVLLVKCGSASAVDATAEDVKEMQAIAALATLEHLVEAVKLLSKVDLRLDAYSPLPLELAIVETGLVHAEHHAAKKAPRAAAPAEARDSAAQAHAYQPVQPKTVGSPARTPAPAAPEPVPQPSARAPEIPAPATPAKDTVRDTAPAAAAPKHPADWDRVLQAIRPANKNLEAFIRNCETTIGEDGTVVIRFIHDIHKAKVEAPENRKLIEDTVLKVYGKPYKVQCVLDVKEKKPQQQTGPQGHLVQAALKMGARIINSTEEQHAK